MPPKRMTAAQALNQILIDDEEDLDASDYGNESDFEDEYDNKTSESEDKFSRSESDNGVTVVDPVTALRAAQPPQAIGRGRGRGIVTVS